MPKFVADSSAATGLAYAAPASGDFVKITAQSFSGSSAVNVNDVFSATYKNYKVFINAAVNSGAVNVHLRFRVSGSDNTTSNYSYQRLIASSTTVSGLRSTAEDKATLADVSTVNSNQELTIFNPFETQLSYLYAGSAYDAATPQIQNWWNGFNATTSFTGFTVYPSGGTLTGQILVYGMKV